jgi:hypothetical protein
MSAGGNDGGNDCPKVSPGRINTQHASSSWNLFSYPPEPYPQFPSSAMLRQTALFALALLPGAFSQVSEGFENGYDSAAWPVYAPSCNQGGKVSLDTTQAHSGKNSMRVDGAGGFCGHIFFGTNKIPSGDVYVRTWL